MPGSADNGRIPDAGLAARLKDGQEAAWQELCDNFGGPLFVYAFHRTGDRDIAEDVRQETLIAAARNIDSYRGEVPLFSWLCGIARNKAADEVRKRKRILDISSRVEAQIGEEIDARAAEEEAPTDPNSIGKASVTEALWILPHDYRKSLILRYVEGLGVNEISVLTGRSYKATESLLARARSALKKRLLEVERNG